MYADLTDRILEATIAPSFSRVGIALRRRAADWESLERHDLRGRTFLVTGATTGIGRAAAEAWARLGAEVLIVGRDAERTTAAADAITTAATATTPVIGLAADLGDLEQVAALANAVAQRCERLDVLAHNAGALDHEYATTPQGFERTLATHVLGPLDLTLRLRPQLAAATDARVLFTSSGGMYTAPLDVDALFAGPDGYGGSVAYARAKRAQIVVAERLATELAADGVVVHAMHPGWADTPGVQRSLPAFRRWTRPVLRNAAEGADTLVWLGVSDAARASTGGFWHDRRLRPTHRLPSTRRADDGVARDELWTRLLVALGRAAVPTS